MIAGIVLAAGPSSRLGRPKQLVTHHGEALVHSAARIMWSSRCSRVAVVVGAHGGSVLEALQDLDITILPNPDWREGMASSLRVGVDWARATKASAAVLTVCDQPLLSTEHVDRLIRAHLRTGETVASRYAGSVGVPALFSSAHFTELSDLHGDVGARQILEDAHAEQGVELVDFPEGAFDVDTPADLPLTSCA